MCIVPCQWSFVGFRLGTALSPANGSYDQSPAVATWRRKPRDKVPRVSSELPYRWRVLLSNGLGGR